MYVCIYICAAYCNTFKSLIQLLLHTRHFQMTCLVDKYISIIQYPLNSVQFNIIYSNICSLITWYK